MFQVYKKVFITAGVAMIAAVLFSFLLNEKVTEAAVHKVIDNSNLNAKEKIVFETDKYSNWKWPASNYPADMSFLVITGTKQLGDKIPENFIEKFKSVDFQTKAILLANLGTVPTGGYEIGIEKVTQSYTNVMVHIRLNKPREGEAVCQVISKPSDFIIIDRDFIDIWGGATILFVDQDGKILSKQKVTISHH